MTKVRVHKTGNFTVMSNYHFKERGMSLKAKGLLSLMLSLPDTWNYSIAGLVTLSKDGKDSVMSALSELEKFGYLTRERLVNDKGQFNGIEYNIFEQPQKEIPIAEKPISANEKAEKPTAENAAQLNTNQLSTNSIKDIKGLNKKEEDIFDVLEDIENDDLRELLIDYIEMRKKIFAPLSRDGLLKLIARMVRLSNGDVRVQKLLLESAIINNWKNVYLPSESELATVQQQTQRELRSLFGLD